MARRKPRFSFLERALKASGGTATGGAIGNYAEFKKGNRSANAGTIPPTARQRVQYGILPFGRLIGASPTPAMREKVTISVFSNTARPTYGLTNAEVGYETADDELMQNSGGFYPALILIKSAKLAATPKVSGITGASYNSYGVSSYTVPFGRHGTEVNRANEKVQFDELASSARAANASSTSMVPEEFNAEVAEVPMGV